MLASLKKSKGVNSRQQTTQSGTKNKNNLHSPTKKQLTQNRPERTPSIYRVSNHQNSKMPEVTWHLLENPARRPEFLKGGKYRGWGSPIHRLREAYMRRVTSMLERPSEMASLRRQSSNDRLRSHVTSQFG